MRIQGTSASHDVDRLHLVQVLCILSQLQGVSGCNGCHVQMHLSVICFVIVGSYVLSASSLWWFLGAEGSEITVPLKAEHCTITWCSAQHFALGPVMGFWLNCCPLEYQHLWWRLSAVGTSAGPGAGNSAWVCSSTSNVQDFLTFLRQGVTL